ncbi:hypothetical protein D3C75_821830 [compost metagenome]
MLGVALKYAKDFNDDRKIVEQLSARYRKELEASLPGLMAEIEIYSDNVAALWDEGISAIVYGRYFAAVESGPYPLWVKERVGKALDELYHDFKDYKPA